jgi:hypothetical protein
MFTSTVPTEEDGKVAKGEKNNMITQRAGCQGLCRSLPDGTKAPEPQPASRQPALPGARRLRATYPFTPFTGMVTGFASLNVTLL